MTTPTPFPPGPANPRPSTPAGGPGPEQGVYFAPPGYEQRAPDSGKTPPWFWVGAALILGIGVGVLIGWPLFSPDAGGASRAAGGSAYDIEVLCNYVEAGREQPLEELEDPENPALWRIQVIVLLAVAAERSEPSASAFADAGAHLRQGVMQVDRDLISEGFDRLSTLCERAQR